MANDLIDEDFEGGSNGAALTTGTASYDTEVGTDLVFSSAQAHEGSLSAHLDTTAAQGFIRWEGLDSADTWFVFRVFVPSLPSGNRYICGVDTSSGTKIGDVRIESNGSVVARNGYTAVVDSGATVLTTNDWHRIAIRYHPNTTGGVELKLYLGSNVDGTTPDFSGSGNSTVVGNVDRFFIGSTTNDDMDIYFDLVEGSSTAEPLPAGGSDTTDPVAVVSLTAKDATYNSSDTLTGCTFDVTAAASTDNVGVTGYSWSDNSAGGSFSSTTVAAPTWTPPDLTSGPWTLTCTVSDAAANTDAAGVSVDVPSSSAGATPISGVAVGASGSAI
jgi:hypothetical protein